MLDRLSLPVAVIAVGLAVVAFTLIPGRCRAQGFEPISPEELKMTSEPYAPGAPAVILFREVDSDDNGITSHQNNYLRIKILTEEGRKYANVEIPFVKSLEEINNLQARTIRPDGSVAAFDGQVFEKTIAKAQQLKYLAKTFTLPDVQVGSIVEYRYKMDLTEHRVFSSHWILSSDLFTRSARFSLKPYVGIYKPVTLRWSWQGLGPGVTPKEGTDHIIRMEVQNIPAFHEEDFMPPPYEVKARVDFIYESEFREGDPDLYWQHVGRVRNAALETFLDKHKAMESAVAQIVSPNDPPEVKLRKIYSRVQQLRNRSFEIRKTVQEEKRDKNEDRPDENVEEVWRRGYGTHAGLTWLYLALVRAAGFEAYGVLTPSRRDYFFTPKTMESWKLSNAVVLVKLNGNDLYFDPGAEFTSYGMLIWSETAVPGLRLDKDGGTWIKTVLPQASESRILHTAKLKLTESGNLEGKVTLTYTGLEAMYHRLDVRNDDDVARKKFIEERIKTLIPGTAEVHLTSQPDWTNTEKPLTAEFDVNIPEWASSAGKHTVIPAGLFTAVEKHLFEHANRVYPIYFRYPYEKEDDLTIELPAGWQVSSVPPPSTRDGHVVRYNLTVENNKTTIHVTRKLTFDFLMLDQKYYTALRDFFQSVRNGDDGQIVLQPAPATASN